MEMVQWASDSGHLFVAAAGNDGEGLDANAAAYVRSDEPPRRLRAAANAAAGMPHLNELFVDDRRLDVRLLKVAAMRDVLDLMACVEGTGVPRPQVTRRSRYGQSYARTSMASMRTRRGSMATSWPWRASR